MTVASRIRSVSDDIVPRDLGFAVRFWDGSTLGPSDVATTVHIRSPDALRRFLYAPNNLGLGRAYVAGELDVEGDLIEALRVRNSLGDGGAVKLSAANWYRVLKEAWSLGAIGRPLPPPPEEIRLRGPRHSRQRDLDAIAAHYDISNEFYRLMLGPTMAYSCGYFEGTESLDEAQTAKYDLICGQLGLGRGQRLLDVGCGWGGLVVHAAQHYGVDAVGVTLSRSQQQLAEQRVADAGLAAQVDIRFQDYRDIDDGPYDAISSIGMFEHIGVAQLTDYLARLHLLLGPGGRFVNDGICKGSLKSRRSGIAFMDRYVFPDYELHDLAAVTDALNRGGFEVCKVLCLRQDYALTLRHWLDNLDGSERVAIGLVGGPRTRIWRIYLAGLVVYFEADRTTDYQVLATRGD